MPATATLPWRAVRRSSRPTRALAVPVSGSAGGVGPLSHASPLTLLTMVDLGGYVIILVETKDKKIKLYGKCLAIMRCLTQYTFRVSVGWSSAELLN